MTQACFLISRELGKSYADVDAMVALIEGWPPEVSIAASIRDRDGDIVVLVEAVATTLYRDGTWVSPILHTRWPAGTPLFQRFDPWFP